MRYFSNKFSKIAKRLRPLTFDFGDLRLRVWQTCVSIQFKYLFVTL